MIAFGALFAVNVEIDVLKSDRELKHFWRSTGLSPSVPKTNYEFLLSDDEKLNIAIIGSVPNKGIQQIRIHWLINLISYTNGAYNFTRLDELLDWIHAEKLRPGFELMGTPTNIEPGNVTNLHRFWFDITNQIATRYISRYGLEAVKKWRFETWNEPDLKMYNNFNFTLEDYVTYVFACAEGLQSAVDSNNRNKFIAAAEHVSNSSKLRLGGPAGLFKQRDSHPLCWGLLKMCNSISAAACPLQYISFHKKGDGTSGQVLSKDLDFLDIIHSDYPNLRHVPIANDEADILTNWSLDESWRGDTRYAAMVTKVILDHYKEIVVKRNIQIEVLSNDNGFLNYHPYYFTQRTLLARFQMNNTTPPHIQFIKKPVHAAMGLLSILGRRFIPEQINHFNPLVTILASRSAEELAALIVYANDTADGGAIEEINIEFLNLPRSDCKYVIYVLDNVNTNPFKLWKTSGAPVFPSRRLRRQMRAVQEPRRVAGPTSPPPEFRAALRLTLRLTLPSVALVHVCSRSGSPVPGRPTHLHALNVTRNEVLLIWKDNKVNSKCISTYEVEFQWTCMSAGGQFKRINADDIIFLSYQHDGTDGSDGGCDAAVGRYRVRAVDYWGRAGPHSRVINYPQ